MSEPIILAVPKGRILEEALPLLAHAGIIPEPAFVDEGSRALRFKTNRADIDLIRVRAFDVATFVAHGAAQLGIVGSATDDPRGWSPVRVATKYPSLTRRHFEARGVQAECITLNGAMELAPLLALAPRIVDLVSSGRTLKENGLVEVETIMEVSSRLIANRAAFKTRPEMVPLVDAFRRAVEAQESARAPA